MTAWLTLAATGPAALGWGGTLGLGIYVLKILAVIGGATVGGLGSGWGLRMFVRLNDPGDPAFEIVPASGVPITAFGLLNCGVFVILKNSPRS